jgi:hypothetical protein
MKHFLFTVSVVLRSPVAAKTMKLQQTEFDNDACLVGYFINIAASANSLEEARPLVKAAINDGEIDWSESKQNEIDLTDCAPEIAKNFKNSPFPNVWYRSGRIFHPAVRHKR